MMKENKNKILTEPQKTDNDSLSVVEAQVIPPKNSFILGDCMDYLRLFPPNFFDLAIVDPPYGMEKNTYGSAKDGVETKFDCSIKNHRDWDSPPTQEYFSELDRISKNQIIWGVNYFTEKINFGAGRIFWNKDRTGDFSDGEIAYQSFTNAVREVKYRWNGMLQQNMKEKEERIHPTQKPIGLYRWLLKTYALAGDFILDTHVGSASSLIACTELGFDYIGFEKDKEYYTMAKSRLGRATRKYELFEAV